MASSPIALELTLIESSGGWYKPGWPTLYCWFNALHVPGSPHDEGKVSVLARDYRTDTWREFTRRVTAEQSHEILSRLRAVGLPGRVPHVQCVFDTSDGWIKLVVWVRVEGQTQSFEIEMHSSGFEGADAGGLSVLFRHLFALAGFEGFSRVVYGHPANDIDPGA